jgi:hypothetical protein
MSVAQPSEAAHERCTRHISKHAAGRQCSVCAILNDRRLPWCSLCTAGLSLVCGARLSTLKTSQCVCAARLSTIHHVGKGIVAWLSTGLVR